MLQFWCVDGFNDEEDEEDLIEVEAPEINVYDISGDGNFQGLVSCVSNKIHNIILPWWWCKIHNVINKKQGNIGIVVVRIPVEMYHRVYWSQ